MAKKKHGPYEVRTRSHGDDQDKRRGTHDSPDDALHHADELYRSGQHDTVTVVDQSDQRCIHHLPEQEPTDDAGVQEPTD